MAISRDGSYTVTPGTDWPTANYVPTLYAKQALVKWYTGTMFNDCCNTDYEGQFSKMGDSIVIRTTPDITVGTYTIGDAITYQVPAEDSTSMSIDKALYTAYQIDDIDALQTDMPLLQMYASDAAEQIKISVDSDVLQTMATGVAAANQGATAGAITNTAMGTNGSAITIDATNASDYIVAMNSILDESNVPDADRFVILPAWYCQMLKTGDLKRADITGDSTGVIRSGLVGMIDRTKVYQSNQVYQQTAGEFSVVAGVKAATSFAMQLNKADRLPIQDTFGEYIRSLYVYGRKVLKDDGLVKLICSK